MEKIQENICKQACSYVFVHSFTKIPEREVRIATRNFDKLLIVIYFPVSLHIACH